MLEEVLVFGGNMVLTEFSLLSFKLLVHSVFLAPIRNKKHNDERAQPSCHWYYPFQVTLQIIVVVIIFRSV